MPTLAQMVARLQPYQEQIDCDEQIEVAGETFHIKDIKRVYREIGMPITDLGTTIDQVECTLIPEPWNEHDPNAVAVMIGTHHVGYVPADQAPDYAEALGRMAARGYAITGTARIWAKSDAGVVRARVTVLVPESDAVDSVSH